MEKKKIDIKPTEVEAFNNIYIKKFKNQSYPIFSNIEFNLHGSCNRRCAFCPRVDESIWPNLEEELSMELFDKILSELKMINYSGRISFSGFSEPFLHSNLKEIIKKITLNIPEAKSEIITNGDYLKDDNVQELFKEGLQYMYVSLYTNKETFDYLLSIKEKLKKEYQEKFNIRPRNLGRKNTFGLNLNNRAGAVDYTKFGMKQEKILPLKQGCNYPMFTIFVDYNGDCLICPDDWDKRKVVGSAKKDNIVNIWLGEIFHKVRKRLLNSDRNDSPCDKCDVNGLLNGGSFADKWNSYYKSE